MPLLLATALSPSLAERESFVASVTDRDTEEIETSAGHLAVAIAEYEPSAIAIGRAVEGALRFLDAEIRVPSSASARSRWRWWSGPSRRSASPGRTVSSCSPSAPART